MNASRQFAAALTAVAVLSAGKQSRSQSSITSPLQNVPAACNAGPATAPGAFPSYLDDGFVQLKAAVPALRNLRFEAHPATLEHEDESANILERTGEVISTMLPRVPNLIAKEELSQAAVPLPYPVINSIPGGVIGSGRRSAPPTLGPVTHQLEGEELHRALQDLMGSSRNRTTFTYRIRTDTDPTYGVVLNESRINAQNEAVEISSTMPGHPHSVGFGSTWLMFTDNQQFESRFRYLGQQKLGNRETFVLAYAQIQDRVTLPSQVMMDNIACPYFSQGILWIDQSIFQIVALQTDLLFPLPGIHLKRLRSELHFGEIRIPERNLTLWMPSDVEISWETRDTAATELHRYTNYRLFAATSRILAPDPE